MGYESSISPTDRPCFLVRSNVVQLAISDVVPSRLTDFGLAKMGLRGGPGW